MILGLSNLVNKHVKNNEEILLLENNLSRIISMLCTESNDNKKVEYCKKNNIPLIIIPFDKTKIELEDLL